MANAHKPRRPSKATRWRTPRQTSRPLQAAHKRAALNTPDKTEAAPATSSAKGARGNTGSKNAKKPPTIVTAALKEGIKPLVSLGRKKGYLTYDEVNSFLPE
ncbi:MAG: RNA polymerase sigma factor region1.1 domain-containing protein, partial [Candidatus Methylomirabilis oxyfera]|nr:RNA polymerase sigma factor region1.1 domain-containing protein [Candidatus Methylomirabilis oxyfera]